LLVVLFRFLIFNWGYWRQKADEWPDNPPPWCKPLVVKDKHKRPSNGPPGGPLLLYMWK